MVRGLAASIFAQTACFIKLVRRMFMRGAAFLLFRKAALPHPVAQCRAARATKSLVDVDSVDGIFFFLHGNALVSPDHLERVAGLGALVAPCGNGLKHRAIV